MRQFSDDFIFSHAAPNFGNNSDRILPESIYSFDLDLFVLIFRQWVMKYYRNPVIYCTKLSNFMTLSFYLQNQLSYKYKYKCL